jgi:hypothetical protein
VISANNSHIIRLELFKFIDMLKTLWATVQKGEIELLEASELPEGSRILVTVLTSDYESEFWIQGSQKSLEAVWDRPEDDVYAHLLY